MGALHSHFALTLYISPSRHYSFNPMFVHEAGCSLANVVVGDLWIGMDEIPLLLIAYFSIRVFDFSLAYCYACYDSTSIFFSSKYTAVLCAKRL